MSSKLNNMILEQGHLYHIFNQGNNRQKIFFKRDNYFFFLKKIDIYITPYADIIAWCLMPNHFHLMVYVNFLDRGKSDSLTLSEVNTNQETGRVTDESETFTRRDKSDSLTLSEAITITNRTFNESIGLLLRSYTQAINKQENRSGSLFKPHTKAQCLTKSDGVTPAFYNTSSGAKINIPIPEREYPQACFNYIHDNPVEAGLVKHPENWEFSSYSDYCGLREGKLVNRDKAGEFGLK
jgi:putative transposase